MPVQTERRTFANGADIAPLLEQVADLGEQHLHQPIRLDVTLWQDGDIDVCAQHEYGRYLGSEWSGFEVLRYERERERFVLRYVEENEATGSEIVRLSRDLDVEPRA